VANAGGPYAITRALLPLMPRAADSVVIGISSLSALTGTGSNIAYCAAKAALDTTMMSLARVFGPIRFLCVSPAAVDTGFVPGRGRADLEKLAAATPLARVTTAEDVAGAVYAAAALLKMSTGTRLIVDGGKSL
jgi:3-oxoacyl-[acyl-carrier protein] reductase